MKSLVCHVPVNLTLRQKKNKVQFYHQNINVYHKFLNLGLDGDDIKKILKHNKRMFEFG